MTYKRLLNDSLVAILVGFACLVMGYMIGRQVSIPIGGVSSVQAQDVISPIP